MHTYIHTCTHKHTYKHIHPYTHAHTYTYTHLPCIHTYTHINTHIHAHTHVCTPCTHKHAHTHACMHIFPYTHTNTYTYTCNIHTHTHPWQHLPSYHIIIQGSLMVTFQVPPWPWHDPQPPLTQNPDSSQSHSYTQILFGAPSKIPEHERRFHVSRIHLPFQGLAPTLRFKLQAEHSSAFLEMQKEPPTFA